MLIVILKTFGTPSHVDERKLCHFDIPVRVYQKPVWHCTLNAIIYYGNMSKILISAIIYTDGIRSMGAGGARHMKDLGQHRLSYGLIIAWQHQAITWSNVDSFCHEHISINLYSELKTFQFKKMHPSGRIVCKMAAILFQPQCIKRAWQSTAWPHPILCLVGWKSPLDNEKEP